MLSEEQLCVLRPVVIQDTTMAVFTVLAKEDPVPEQAAHSGLIPAIIAGAMEAVMGAMAGWAVYQIAAHFNLDQKVKGSPLAALVILSVHYMLAQEPEVLVVHEAGEVLEVLVEAPMGVVLKELVVMRLRELAVAAEVVVIPQV